MKQDFSRLITKCIRGDELSCKALYEEYMPYSYGVIIRYGVKNQEIKDYLQIVFSEVFRSLKNYDDSKAGFKTWLTRITVNKILEQRRNNSRGIELDSISEKDYALQYNQEIESEIDKEYMFRILSSMPSQFSLVFNMFIIDGYSHKEISEILEISEGSSRILLKRGRDWAKVALNRFLQTT